MKILVVVDMQNDFITGSLGTPEAQAIVPNVKKKIEEYVKNGNTVIFTRDTHRRNYLETREGKNLPVEHCILGTHGWNIHEELYPLTGDDGNAEHYLVFDKPTFGCRELVDYIDHNLYYWGLDEIELCGLCSDICVISNAILLKENFYESCEISVDANCCAGVTPETHEAALKTMEMCQIVVKH